MTAEEFFKENVLHCIENGWYPGAMTLIGKRNMNGRQVIWREEVLAALDWTYSSEGRHHWRPPFGFSCIEYRKDGLAIMVLSE